MNFDSRTERDFEQAHIEILENKVEKLENVILIIQSISKDDTLPTSKRLAIISKLVNGL